MISGKPMKIFVVDDDPSMLNLMGMLLEARGHEVILNHKGSSASVDIYDEMPDCLITDLIMPGLNGIELTRELRDDPDTASMKIIMVTSDTKEISRIKAVEAGVDAYIVKPLDPGTFAQTVEKVFWQTD